MPYMILPSEKITLSDSVRDRIVELCPDVGPANAEIVEAYRVELKYLYPSENDEFMKPNEGDLLLVVRSLADSKLYYRSLSVDNELSKDFPTTPDQVNLRISHELRVGDAVYRRFYAHE